MRVTKNEEIISSLFYDRFHTFEEMREPELRHYHESSVMPEDLAGYLQVQKAFPINGFVVVGNIVYLYIRRNLTANIMKDNKLTCCCEFYIIFNHIRPPL